MDSDVIVEICTDRDVYGPGQSLTGLVNIVTRRPLVIDSIKARLFGDAVVHFTNKELHPFSNSRVFVDEEKELWHYSTLQEMLGMPTYDHNANRCERGYLTGKSQFRFAYKLPDNLATSFKCPGSPVQVKYTLTVTLNVDNHVLVHHEHPLTVVAAQKRITRALGNDRVVHSKCFPMMKSRSLFIECVLEHAVLSPIGRLQATITVANRWKQSIKYVHMNIIKKIEAVGYQDDTSVVEKNTVLLETTGVGLPTSKRKIAPGETYSFSPNFNVPALPPSMEVPGLLRVAYLLNIAVGRAHNYVIASLNVPFTIVADVVDMTPTLQPQREELLIDLTPSTWTPTTPSMAQAIDLLA